MSTLFLGLPLPRLGKGDSLPVKTSACDSPCALGSPSAGHFDVERRFPELFRVFLGVPLVFLRTGEDSSPALRGTVLVKVRSAKHMEGERWAALRPSG